MAEESELAIIISAKDQASATFSKLGENLGNLKTQLDKIKPGADIVQGALLGVGATAAGVGVASYKLASDFEDAMTLIQTQAGGSAEEVKNMSAAVLNLAGETATAPKTLAEGLFYVESAGYRGAQALDILKLAAEGAKVGHADLSQTANVLTTIMNSHVKGVNNATDAMGVMNATVGAGKMKMQDLVDAMSTGILPVAKGAGISMQQLGATLAVFTNNGVPAVDAASRLRMSIGMMVTPSSAGTAALKEMGMAQDQLAKDMQSGGILKAADDLNSHMSKLSQIGKEQVFGKMFGTREGATMMTLVGGVDQLKDRLNQVNQTGGNFGNAWKKISEDAGTALERLGTSIQSIAINFGNKLLPAVTNTANFLADNLVPALTNALTWFDKNKVVLGVLAGIITTVVMPAMLMYWVQMATKNTLAVIDFIAQEWKAIAVLIAKSIQVTIAIAQWIIHNTIVLAGAVASGIMTVATGALTVAMFLLTSPIGLVILAIGAVIAIGFLLITHWKQVQEVGKTIFNAVGAFFTGLGATVKGVVNQIIADIRAMINGIIDGIDTMIKGANSIGSKIHLPSIPTIPHLASGTSYFGGGMALVGESGPEIISLPRGSSVTPNSQINNTYNRNPQITLGPVYVQNQADIDILVQKLSMALKYDSGY